MGKERRLKSNQDRSGRVERPVQVRTEGAAEVEALDAAVRRSVKLHGP
jgi:hypothetical protein